MASKTQKMRAWEESIKQKIMDGYRRGVCNKNGGTIPYKRTTQCPDGTPFVPKRIFSVGANPVIRVWARDENGNLIGD